MANTVKEYRDKARQLLGELPFQKISDSPTVKHYTDWRLFEPYFDRIDLCGDTGLEVEALEGRVEVKDASRFGENPRLAELIRPEESKITAAHYTALKDALVVRVSRKSRLIIRSREGMGSSQVHARHLILLLEPGSRSEIMVEASGFRDDALETLFIELYAGENSESNMLFYAEPPLDSPSFFLIKKLMEKGSKLRYGYLSAGGFMHHQREEAIMLEEAELRSGGAFVAGKGEKVDYFASAVHEGPRGFSRLRATGVALEGGYAVARGVAKIDKRGEWSNTLFEGGVVLLGEGARGYSAPMLEIGTGNVEEARHEALGSKPDEETIFYLQSRGLSKVEAWRIIVYGAIEHQLDFLEGWAREEAEERSIKILNTKLRDIKTF